MFDGPSRRKFIEEIICKVLRAEAGAFKVRGVLNASTEAPKAQIEAPPPAPAVQVALEEDAPILDEVISIFGGNIVDEDKAKE